MARRTTRNVRSEAATVTQRRREALRRRTAEQTAAGCGASSHLVSHRLQLLLERRLELIEVVLERHTRLPCRARGGSLVPRAVRDPPAGLGRGDARCARAGACAGGGGAAPRGRDRQAPTGGRARNGGAERGGAARRRSGVRRSGGGAHGGGARRHSLHAGASPVASRQKHGWRYEWRRRQRVHTALGAGGWNAGAGAASGNRGVALGRRARRTWLLLHDCRGGGRPCPHRGRAAARAHNRCSLPPRRPSHFQRRAYGTGHDGARAADVLSPPPFSEALAELGPAPSAVSAAAAPADADAVPAAASSLASAVLLPMQAWVTTGVHGLGLLEQSAIETL
eukprot:scaffold30270_cov72-Phaeocystis_antarctica.AAC.1